MRLGEMLYLAVAIGILSDANQFILSIKLYFKHNRRSLGAFYKALNGWTKATVTLSSSSGGRYRD